jgi:hypothetical protein
MNTNYLKNIFKNTNSPTRENVAYKNGVSESFPEQQNIKGKIVNTQSMKAKSISINSSPKFLVNKVDYNNQIINERNIREDRKVPTLIVKEKLDLIPERANSSGPIKRSKMIF